MGGEEGGSSRDLLNWSGGDGGSGDKNFFNGECTQVANKRIIETPKQNYEQMKMADTLLKLRPLCLKLNLSSFQLDSLNQAVEPQNHPNLRQPISEKLKATNFEATFLRIGQWERTKKNEGDLIAKCYFAKKKLVWEFLQGNLKNKIEIQWNEIIGIRALLQDHKPGILEIELNRAPAFFEEIDPQPRKHTIWRPTSDFTGGEASSYRRHYLVFPPGMLDKHYDKLLQCDQRLYALNQKRFPTLKTPYFDESYHFSIFSSDYRSHIPTTNFAFASVPSPLMSTHPHSFKELTSPISVMDFSHSDDVQHVTSSNVLDNRTTALWAAAPQGINSLPPFPTPIRPLMNQLNAAVPYQNYNRPSSAYSSNIVNNLLTNLEQHLFSDKQVGYYDENYHMQRVESLNALVNLPRDQEELASEDSSQQTFYGPETSTDYGSGFGGQLSVNSSQRAFHGSNSGLIVQGIEQLQVYQPPLALPPPLHPHISTMHQAWDNLTYAPESFGQDNGIDEGNHWN